MAITKIHPIRFSTLSAIEYITDPSKTDDKLLVTSYRCDPSIADVEFAITASKGSKTGSVKAQHLIQSFAPGEVDPKTAHEIGIKLADRFTKGIHQYVITTHIDHDHVHNHIIFNQVDFMQHKKFRMNQTTFKNMQLINDDLCKSYGLSVIDNKKKRSVSYYDWQKVRQAKTSREILKRNIDLCISLSNDFDEFLTNMQKIGYTIKNTGTYYSFKLPDQERFKRLKTLGDDYSEEGIKKRMQLRSLSAASVPSRPSQYHSLLLSGIKQDISQKSVAYRRKVASSDIQKLAQTYNFLSEKGLLSFEKLQTYVTSLTETRKEIRSSIKEIESRLSDLSQAKEYLENIEKYQNIYDKYVASKKDPSFFNRNRAAILLFEGAQNGLKQIEIYKKMDAAQIAGEIEQLLLKKEMLKNELTLTISQLSEVSDHYQNAGYILGRDVQDVKKEPEEQKTKGEKSDKTHRSYY